MNSQHTPTSQTNHLLGYPDNARLLIINADDLGMCYAVNTAIFHVLENGIVSSTTLMVPCPWALHAIHFLQAHPHVSFGIHLTVISETTDYGWGPVTPKDQVPSLIDSTGYFYSLARRSEFLAQAKLHEVETEFRAQIDTVLRAGLKPTHLDWHCLNNGGRNDIFDLTVTLAKTYGLAMRVSGSPYKDALHTNGLPANDHDLMNSYAVKLDDKTARYCQMLRDLPVGLTEWAVHPGYDSGELRTIEPEEWQVRPSDFEFLISPEGRETLQQEGVMLLNYSALQKVWQTHNA